MASQTIRFNEPQDVTLKFDEGREVTGAYGPQIMFTTVDGASFYLDQNCPVLEQMKHLGVRAGVPIRIAKTGSGKFIKWSVERLDTPQSSNGSARPASQVAPGSAAQMLASTNNRQSEFTAAPSQPVVALSSQLLAGCLVAAIDATLIAESYATSKSAKISFTPEDIRAMGLTLYIQHAKQLEQFARDSRDQAQGGATWRQ